MTWYSVINIGSITCIWIIFFKKRRLIWHSRKYWVLFLVTYTLTELFGSLIAMKTNNNLWLYNVSKPIQFLFLILYFSRILHFSRAKTIGSLFAGLVSAILLFIFHKIDAYNSLAEVIYGACITLACVGYFNKIIRGREALELGTSEFWFCSALLVLYGGALCINGSIDFLMKVNLSLASKLFFGLVVTSYIFYALTIYALVQYRKPNIFN